MFDHLGFIVRFIRSTFRAKGFDAALSQQLNKAARNCLGAIENMEREDLETEDMDAFVSHILGLFSMCISYHQSIAVQCLAGHSLNAASLLRAQLEAHLIFMYFILPDEDLTEIAERVGTYRDWVCIRMYHNSKKSKEYDLFTLNPELPAYIKTVEENYEEIKSFYSEDTETFKELIKSQSFLKDKREIAKSSEIEDLYLAVFAETSATVHMADISDRMSNYKTETFSGFKYNFQSTRETMVFSGVSNILLVNAMTAYCDFFQISRKRRVAIFKKIKLVRLPDEE